MNRKTIVAALIAASVLSVAEARVATLDFTFSFLNPLAPDQSSFSAPSTRMPRCPASPTRLSASGASMIPSRRCRCPLQPGCCWPDTVGPPCCDGAGPQVHLPEHGDRAVRAPMAASGRPALA